MLSSNEIGEQFEERVKSILGARRVAQSGGGKFIKLDVRDDACFIYSLKATRTLRDSALRAIWNLWVETKQGTRGPAGHGNGAKPAMAFEIEGEILVLLRLEDHAAILTGEIETYIPSTKGAERRAKALQNPRDR